MRAPLGIKKHISPVIPEAEAFAKAIRDLTRAADLDCARWRACATAAAGMMGGGVGSSP